MQHLYSDPDVYWKMLSVNALHQFSCDVPANNSILLSTQFYYGGNGSPLSRMRGGDEGQGYPLWKTRIRTKYI